VVDFGIRVILGIDASSVGLQTWGCANSARNWSTSINLSLHLLHAGERAIIGDLEVNIAGDRSATAIRSTSTTSIEIIARLVRSLVVVAGLVGNTRRLSVGINGNVISTFARSGVTAVNDVLNGQISGGPSTTTFDVDTVSKSGRGSMSPARSTILRDVLVASGRSVVNSIDISPIESSWKCLWINVFPRQRLANVLSASGVSQSPVSFHVVSTLITTSKHNTRKDIWFAVHGKAYNVTEFLNEHPGGDEVLLERAGKDASSAFDEIGHSPDAHEMMHKYYVGDMDQTETAAPKKTSHANKAAVKPQSSGEISPVLIISVFVFLAGLAYVYFQRMHQ